MEFIFGTVAKYLWLYTLISYIFVVQSLHKRWFKVYTSLQQGTCVLYYGLILQVIVLRHVQNLAIAGHVWQVITQHREFSVQNPLGMEFRS